MVIRCRSRLWQADLQPVADSGWLCRQPGNGDCAVAAARQLPRQPRRFALLSSIDGCYVDAKEAVRRLHNAVALMFTQDGIPCILLRHRAGIFRRQ